MAIASSGAIGVVINALNGGLIPGITSDQLGIGAMPGPGGNPLTLVGGGSLYIVADKGDAARRGGVGLHPVPHRSAVAVDVGGCDGLRAGA